MEKYISQYTKINNIGTTILVIEDEDLLLEEFIAPPSRTTI